MAKVMGTIFGAQGRDPPLGKSESPLSKRVIKDGELELRDEPQLRREAYEQGVKKVVEERMMQRAKEPEVEGKKEALKAEVKEKLVQTKKLDDLVNSSEKNLYTATAVFPFDFFPDKVIIDINKVNVICNMFFWSKQVQGIFIRDIISVLAEAGLFFATLKIISTGFKDTPIEIRYLWREDAIRACRIIQGLVVARKQDIDLSKVDEKDLVKKIEEIGIAQAGS